MLHAVRNQLPSAAILSSVPSINNRQFQVVRERRCFFSTGNGCLSSLRFSPFRTSLFYELRLCFQLLTLMHYVSLTQLLLNCCCTFSPVYVCAFSHTSCKRSVAWSPWRNSISGTRSYLFFIWLTLPILITFMWLYLFLIFRMVLSACLNNQWSRNKKAKLGLPCECEKGCQITSWIISLCLCNFPELFNYSIFANILGQLLHNHSLWQFLQICKHNRRYMSRHIN